MTHEDPCVSKISTKDLSEAVFQGRLPREDLRILVRPGAHAAMLAHAKTSLDNEVCGVMLGLPKKDAQGPFLVVEDVIEGQLAQGAEAKVTFTPEAWEHIFKEQEKRDPDLKMVGWYHTHPRFGIFLSSYDQFIHQNFFGVEPWMIAFVVDPVQEEEGFFYWQKGKTKRASRYWIGDRPRASDGAEFDGRVFADDRRPPEEGRSRLAAAPAVGVAAGAPLASAPSTAQPGLPWHQDPYTLGLMAVVLVLVLGYMGVSFLFPDRGRQQTNEQLKLIMIWQGALNQELRGLRKELHLPPSRDRDLEKLDEVWRKILESERRRAERSNPLRKPQAWGAQPPKDGATPPKDGATPPKDSLPPSPDPPAAPEDEAAGPPRPGGRS